MVVDITVILEVRGDRRRSELPTFERRGTKIRAVDRPHPGDCHRPSRPRPLIYPYSKTVPRLFTNKTTSFRLSLSLFLYSLSSFFLSLFLFPFSLPSSPWQFSFHKTGTLPKITQWMHLPPTHQTPLFPASACPPLMIPLLRLRPLPLPNQTIILTLYSNNRPDGTPMPNLFIPPPFTKTLISSHTKCTHPSRAKSPLTANISTPMLSSHNGLINK